MPPKKKIRVNSAKPTESKVAMTLDDVSPLQLKLRDWMSKAYEVRHGTDEQLPWPLSDGGSLLEICKRCWGDSKVLLADSLAFVKKVGLLPVSATVNDFEQAFMKTKDGCVPKNVCISWQVFCI